MKQQKQKFVMPDATEEEEQETVVLWCDVMHVPVVHVPNEGKRSASYGARLERVGMRPGFPDLFVPIAAGGYHGLFIEMKVGKNKPTAKQQEWIDLLNASGYAAYVCYGAEEAIGKIKEYRRANNEKSK